MKKLLELLFLKNIKGFGNVTINKKYVSLLEPVSTLEECIRLIEDNEKKVSSVDISKAREIAKKKYKEIINDLTLNVITIFDDEYPEKLRDLQDKKPVILYAKGDITALSQPNIAIVGTRKPSEWSMKVEGRLVQKILDLSERIIVSGLALGCDRIAHETTVLAGKRTVAVLPSGVNVITPASHKKLANRVIETGGCLLSEYEPNAKMTLSTYVERDAVIAALSDATMVIECDAKSGTMHTVDAAEQMKRKLACYYIDDVSKGKYSGNELMLKDKGAIKITDTEELALFLEQLNCIPKNTKESEPKQICIEDLLRADAE